MAEALEKIIDADFLECEICLDRFRTPRGLPCLRSFCHECLKRFCRGKRQVLCPNCKKPTAVPEAGLSGFPANFMVNSLQETVDIAKLKIQDESYTPCSKCNQPGKKATVHCTECEESFCEACHQSHNAWISMRKHNVISVENLRSGKVMLPVTTTQDDKCDNHPNEMMRFYCNTCHSCVCRDCILMKQHCRDHDYKSMEEADERPIAGNESVGYMERVASHSPAVGRAPVYAASGSADALNYATRTPPLPERKYEARGETWAKIRQFSTMPEVEYPVNITIHPNGDVAITSGTAAAIFSKNGALMYSFQNTDSTYGEAIAITLDNKYILPGSNKILFYDCQGNHWKSLNTATYDINNKPSHPRTLAVDSRGRIISGLCGDTISIHQGDGRLISKFATPSRLRHLDVTSNGHIIVVFYDYTLQVRDYSGNTIRVVQQPQGVNYWSPGSVCCSKQGEIFVVNCGDESVYRYTADGDRCLGCIISGLDDPLGIAISEDGQQLYVAEMGQSVVKIFQRP